jgi:hypothetical protein
MHQRVELADLRQGLSKLEKLKLLSPEDLEILERIRALRRRIAQMEKEPPRRERRAA